VFGEHWSVGAGALLVAVGSLFCFQVHYIHESCKARPKDMNLSSWIHKEGRGVHSVVNYPTSFLGSFDTNYIIFRNDEKF
jgi:hypothetical protein